MAMDLNYKAGLSFWNAYCDVADMIKVSYSIDNRSGNDNAKK